MNRFILVAVILISNVISFYGQNVITGTIKDEKNDTVTFANIVLFKNNKPLTGVVSDDFGKYEFENIANGTYWLEVSVLGFKTVKSELFTLSETNRNQVLNFTIKEDAQTLNEVVITSKRPTIRQTAEKLIVNFENTEMVNTNLEDVMKRIPGVIVTNNGVSYAGQSGIRILINGKSTDYMDIQTLLQDFPADNISKIELVEQPGAEFDAEGSGPIINIILKKNVKLGTHGNVKAWVGEDEGVEYGTSASVASYKNKLNWQASIGYSEPTWRSDLFVDRSINDAIYKQATISPFGPKNFRLSTGVDYYINHKSSVGVTLSRRNSISDRISSDQTSITINDITDLINTENRYDRQRVVFNVNPYYEYKDDKNKITLDFNYVNYDNKNENNLLKVGNNNTIDFDNQRYFQDGKYEIKTYKGDYKYTFTDDLVVSFGSKLAQVATDNDLRSFTEDNTGNFIFVNEESNRFLIDETIFALYSKLNLTVNKWSFSGGLRFEDSDTKGTSTFTGETKRRKITKLFPSASLSRKMTEHFGSGLSYSYRIQRPSYNSLNTFEYFYSPIASEIGNPDLKPSFTNSLKFNLTYDGQPFFTVGYRKTKDALIQLVAQDDATGEISRSVQNVDEKENWNFRLFAPLSFVKGLDGYTGFIVNYNKLFKANLPTELKISKWSVMWYTNAKYKLPWGINSEISGFYSSGPLEGEIEMDWLASMEFALSKKFMKDKLKLNLGMRKVLDRQFSGKIRRGNINAAILSAESKQNIYLQVTYNFGSKFDKKKKNRNSSQEEQDRINGND